jgi:formylglycine-generating enzyme required for sulfatase activity
MSRKVLIPALIVLIIGGIVLSHLACKKSSVTESPTPADLNKPIGASGGSIESDGITVIVPQGAVSVPATFTINRESNITIPIQTTDAVVDKNNIYTITLKGDTLSKPVRVTIPYSASIIPPGYGEENLAVVHFSGSDWEILQGVVNTQNKTITFETQKFSSFVAGVPTHKVEFPTAFVPLDETITFDNVIMPGPQFQSYDYSDHLVGLFRDPDIYWGVMKAPSGIDPSNQFGNVAYAARYLNDGINSTLNFGKDRQSCLTFKLDLRSTNSFTIEFDYNCKTNSYAALRVELSNSALVLPFTNCSLSWNNLTDDVGHDIFWGDGTWHHLSLNVPTFVFNLTGQTDKVCGGSYSDKIFIRFRFNPQWAGTYPVDYGPFIDNLLFKTDHYDTPQAPTVTTTAITNPTANSATGGGNVTSQGSASVTSRGVCWSTSQNPTTANNKTSDGTGTGTFTSSITSLSSSTPYYVRAYATNTAGTSYGSQVTFTTSAGTGTPPTVTTAAITGPTSNSASGGGNVTSGGSSSVTVRGVCWSISQNPTIADSKTSDGTGTGTFASSITGLSPSTPYYVRAYATNSAGTSYGSQMTFTTSSGTILSGMVAVAGGTFQMGSTNSLDLYADPPHQVTLGSFSIDKYEITYELWKKVRDWALTHGYAEADIAVGRNGYSPIGANNPVSEVNWYDVVIWCNARSEMDGLTPVYYKNSSFIPANINRSGTIDLLNTMVNWSANGYRLPTEAEWEFAARGGTKSGNYIYSGSNTIDDVAWYIKNSPNNTQTVGLKTANELGIYDMSGNVWEWCWDWLGIYTSTAQSDPKGDETGSYRVLRGGSFYIDDYYSRSAYRNYTEPDLRNGYIGFRCVRD